MEEALISRSGRQRCGWNSSPFIIGVMMGVGMVAIGVTYNLEVYLINAFNVGRIDATQIYAIASGCISLAPIVGGIVADSFIGCSAVLAISTLACFLGMLLFSLTASLPSLHPSPCSLSSNTACHPPTAAQLAVLYAAIALLAVGVGGTRYNGMTLGANQFSTASDRAAFFSRSFAALYLSSIAGAILIVYAQDSFGWPAGFALCAAVSVLALLLYFCGKPYKKPPSTFKMGELMPLLKLVPIFCSGVLLSAAISIQTSMTVLQALAMNRRLFPGVLISAGSVNVFVLATAAVSIAALDRASALPPLRRIGVGHAINTAAMAALAATEWKRRSYGGAAPVLWLVPALALVGVGEGFHYPGGVAFYYEEFPAGMKSTATGMMAAVSGGGFYASAGIVAAARKWTGWLKDDVDEARLDKLYAMMAVMGAINFAYFLSCVWVYKRKLGGVRALNFLPQQKIYNFC